MTATFTLDEQIKAVRRELAFRQRAYPKWVASNRMKREEADYQLGVMQAVHDSLTELQAAKEHT